MIADPLFWLIVILLVIVMLPVYAAIISASVYVGKVLALRRLFAAQHKEDVGNGQAYEGD